MRGRGLFILILIFLCHSFAKAQSPSSIYGKVVNDSDHTPLAGVGVTLYTSPAIYISPEGY